MKLSRRELLAAAGASTAALGGCLGRSADGPSAGGGDDGTGTTAANGQADAWRTATLTDARTDETFTVEDLQRPVLLEPFAVWCSTCLRQQKQVKQLHGEVGDAVTSVAVDVDPNEDAAKVRSHVEKHGFDWRYAVASESFSSALADAYGQSVLVPPNAPMVLVCGDGSATRLKDGVKSVEFLRQQVEGC